MAAAQRVYDCVLEKKKLLIKDPCPMAIHSEHAKNCVPTVMSQLIAETRYRDQDPQLK